MTFSRVSFSASLSAEGLGIVTTVYMGIKQLDDTPGLYTRANFLKLFSIMRGRRSRFSGPGGKRWLWGPLSNLSVFATRVATSDFALIRPLRNGKAPGSRQENIG